MSPLLYHLVAEKCVPHLSCLMAHYRLVAVSPACICLAFAPLSMRIAFQILSSFSEDNELLRE